MNKEKDTKIIDLEECIYKNYKPNPKYCESCDGYNYNCPSYKTIKEYLTKEKK